MSNRQNSITKPIGYNSFDSGDTSSHHAREAVYGAMASFAIPSSEDAELLLGYDDRQSTLDYLDNLEKLGSGRARGNNNKRWSLLDKFERRHYCRVRSCAD